MTKHMNPIEFKGDDDIDPTEVVKTALDELTRKVDERIKALETKSIDPKLLERIDEIEKKANRPGGGASREEDEAAQLETKAFDAYLRKGREAGDLELKTLTVSSDPNGGYLAPPEFSTEFIRELAEYSPIRNIASVRTTGAPSVKYPARTGLGSNARWVSEIETRPKSEPTFGGHEIVVKELATYVDISNQLLADSAGAADREVRAALAEDFGVKEGAAFVNGDGLLAPQGFMTANAIDPYVNGHATTLNTDKLIGMMYALPAVYRNKGTWVMNSSTLGVIRTLKDGSGNYLWQPSFQAGQPETILGRPVVDAPDMDDIGSGKYPVAFGDFNAGYRIVDRIGLSILVNPYLLATNGITRIHASRRVGGGVIRPAALRKLKMATS